MSERYDPNSRHHRELNPQPPLWSLHGKIHAYADWLAQDPSRVAYVFPKSKHGRRLSDDVRAALLGGWSVGLQRTFNPKFPNRVVEVDPRDYDGRAPVDEAPSWADEHLIVLHVA